MADYRVEHDTFGEIRVPSDKLWGAQTQRSLEHFRISIEKMPEALIRALLIVKRSSARVNASSSCVTTAGDSALAFPFAIATRAMRS